MVSDVLLPYLLRPILFGVDAATAFLPFKGMCSQLRLLLLGFLIPQRLPARELDAAAPHDFTHFPIDLHGFLGVEKQLAVDFSHVELFVVGIDGVVGDPAFREIILFLELPHDIVGVTLAVGRLDCYCRGKHVALNVSLM